MEHRTKCILFLIALISFISIIKPVFATEISLQFSFSEPELRKVDEYDSIFMKDLHNFGNPGEPVLPLKNVRVLIPYNEEIENIEVITNKKIIIDGKYLIEPGQFPVYIDSDIDSKTLPNETIYESLVPFPEKIFLRKSIQYKRGYKILEINIYPIQYIPKKGEISYFDNIKLLITTKPITEKSISTQITNKPKIRNLPKDLKLISNIVDNPTEINSYKIKKTKEVKQTPLNSIPLTSYDYVIITNENLKSSFQPLVDWKNSRGIGTTIVTTEYIYSNYNGIDKQEKIRNFIIDAYNNWGIEYVLLGGDDEIIPYRGVYGYVESSDGVEIDENIPCDMYYGALDGNWDNDGDEIYGEGDGTNTGTPYATGTSGEEADFYAEVFVGRATVDEISEAINFVNKIIFYEQSLSTYLNKSLMIGEKLDSDTWGSDAKDVAKTYFPSNYLFTDLYDRDGTFNKNAVINEINNGDYRIINHNGHADSWSVMGLSFSDVDSLENDKPVLVYSQGCYSGAFDALLHEAIGEHFILTKNAAFAYIGNSRYGWYHSGSTSGPGDTFDYEFFNAIFNENIKNIGKALQDSKEDLRGATGMTGPYRWIYFDLNLFGDPETPIQEIIIQPQYCPVSTQNANEEYITWIHLNGNEKSSGSSTYSDYTDTIFTTLQKGGIYTLYVEGHTTSEWLEYVKAWIDFNNDKAFTADEEIDLDYNTFSGYYVFSNNFTVPDNAVTSETRMRIYLKYGDVPSPCENATFGEIEDYVIKISEADDIAPSLWISGYGAGYVQAGEQVIINANVYDSSGISHVFADIESPDENILGTIELYDDGLHNDGSENDGIYGNTWTTDLGEKNYYLDFTASDIYGNTAIYDNLDVFTTIPFSQTSDILLVDASSYSYIDYYENSLNSNNYSYDLWDFDLRGEIDSDVINLFDLCIWSSPSSAPDYNQRTILSQFLDNGGNLFISGQDIGYYIGDTEFYNNYLHANYVTDNVDLYNLNGVQGDPITDGIDIGILGGDGADNQWWPSEIDPIYPAEPIFFYNNTTSAESLTEFTVNRISVDLGSGWTNYTFHIIPIFGLSPPYKMNYDENYPINTSHVKIIDSGMKEIDLETYSYCTCHPFGLLRFCEGNGCLQEGQVSGDMPHDSEFTQIVYDANPIAIGYCKTTDTGIEICYNNETSVSIETKLDSLPIFYYENISGEFDVSEAPQDYVSKKIEKKESVKENYILSGASGKQIAALRTDTDIYKVVYFAFGFEAINDEIDRNLVMERVIEWIQTEQDTDGDGDPDATDCNSTNPNIHHGAEEICNGVDDDCDTEIDDEPEASISCVDNIDCTVDQCVNGSCSNIPDDGLCDNGFYCDGIETCDPTLDCQADSPIDCSDNLFCTVNEYCDEELDDCMYDDRDCGTNDLIGIATCTNNPDNNPFTWDYRESFMSICNEELDICTTGDETISHTCDKSECGAECESDLDCPNYCEDSMRYFDGNCDLDCGCNYQMEDCNDLDDWYDTGNIQWIDYTQCTEKKQKEQEYRDYSCNINGCTHIQTDIQWIDIGEIRNKQDGISCNDNQWCTINDQCDSGVCIGSERDCSSAGNQCNSGVCDEDSDQCIAEPKIDGTDCDDGLFCTIDDECISGVCEGNNRDCSDDYTCTDDSCDEDNDQCVNKPNDNNCVFPEICNPIYFSQPTGCGEITGCIGQSDGTICDDGIYCNGLDECQSEVCVNIGPKVDCNNLDDQCNIGICNEELNQCEKDSSSKERLDCDDGLFCIIDETCKSGVCTGYENTCDDSVSCTIDSCNEDNDQCINTPDNSYCDNEVFCDGTEYCDIELGCQDDTPIDCSDNNLPEIATCTNNPDNNPFTWDYTDGFTSICDEDSDLCTQGLYSFIHTCNKTICGAECDNDLDCENTDCDYLDGCHQGQKYYDCDDVSNECIECSCSENSCPSYTICSQTGTDIDVDGWDIECGDCNDTNELIYPEATEICNDGIDNDCDGLTDMNDDDCIIEPEGTYSNSSISIIGNQSTEIDAISDTDTKLEISTINNVTNGSINITKYSQNPEEANFGVTALNKYIEIEANSEITDNLSWIIIKIYYTDEEVSNAGIDESTLRIYYYNGDDWEPYNPPNGNVNVDENYVWANSTHLSLYGLYGESVPSTTTTTIPTTTTTKPSSGGGGGGGGGAPRTTTTTTIQSNITTTTSIPIETKEESTTITTTSTTVPATRLSPITGLITFVNSPKGMATISSIIIIAIILIICFLPEKGLYHRYKKKNKNQNKDLIEEEIE